MLRNATCELLRGWQASRHIDAYPKICKSIHTGLSFDVYTAASAGASSASIRHDTNTRRDDAFNNDRHSWDPTRTIRRQGSTDKRRTVDPLNWDERTPLRRQTERKLRLKKSWASLSPNKLLDAFVTSDGPTYELKKTIAGIRSHRMPIVLLQMYLRQEAEANSERDENMLQLLPSKTEWKKVTTVVNRNGHTEEDLGQYLYILLGANDEERCRRFLETDTIKPTFLINFLLRKDASIWTVSLLDRLLKYFRLQALSTPDSFQDIVAVTGKSGPTGEAVLSRSRQAMLNMAPDDFSRLMTRFAAHCRRLEPRLITTLAEIVAERLSWHQMTGDIPERTYHEQCKLFNLALHTFASRDDIDIRHKQAPNPYLWEAQRILLDKSDQLPKTLLADKKAFKAIRAVLAGLPKNHAESHSARRYSQAWPPYLRPGDGMDEAMEPEESWTRTVQAGVMMQEAGFPKDQDDEALDILQGVAFDGTPTIQHRALIDPNRRFRPWAASIKATRNAHEAWARFQQPPRRGQQPGIAEYAVMFEKLLVRDVDSTAGRLPGDNSLNFPVHEERNLTELEKARLRPPGVDELYERMKRSGLAPGGYCLRVLVSNAESVEKASQYLLESTLPWRQARSLIADDSDHEALKQVPLSILSAYVIVSTKQRGIRHMLRAMRLVEIRLGREHHAWASYLWMPILKVLGHHHRRLRIPLGQQLRLAVQLLEHIQTCHGPSSTLFQRFANTLRRILQREVTKMISAGMQSGTSAQANPLSRLYDPDHGRIQDAHSEEMPPGRDEDGDALSLAMAQRAATRLKELFDLLVEDEKQRRSLLGPDETLYLDAMLLRRDPISAPVAHDYMLSLAFAGEFMEMARVIKWLIREWGNDQLVEELEGLDEMPSEADIQEALCAFRAFAEPMLEEATVVSVLDTLQESPASWVWPDNDQIELYFKGRHMANRDLRELLDHVRKQRQRQSNMDSPIAEEQDDETKANDPAK